MKENSCWDLSESSGTMLWSKKQEYGCSNWDSIKLGPALEHETIYKCGYECLGRADCYAFNFQPAGCQGAERLKEGACYLFTAAIGGGCQEAPNECWDLYYILGAGPGGHQSLDAAATTTSTSTTGFR